MSLLPYLLSEISRPNLYDQHFGLCLLDDDLPLDPYYGYTPSSGPILLRSYRKPHRFNPTSISGLSRVKNNDNNFKVNLDVQQFKPEEVSVKVSNGYVIVDGKHEERSDEHGYISRQFTRRYKLPDNVDENSITSTLSSDGVLSIGAPKKVLKNATDERPIQIVQTNEPSIKRQPTKEKSEIESMETEANE